MNFPRQSQFSFFSVLLYLEHSVYTTFHVILPWLEATQVSINRQVEKKVVVHITMEYYLVIKKKKNLTICNSIYGPRGYYAKWDISVRKTNTIWFHLHVESREQYKPTNNNRLIDTENRLMVTRGDINWGNGWKRWRDWEVQIGSYKIVMGM